MPHADIVGSLLRPAALLSTREGFAAGRVDAKALELAEDRAVDDAIAMQERAGLGIVTDGEMRRLSFQSQLPEAVEGFGDFDIGAFLWGDWHGDEQVGALKLDRPPTLGVVGKLRRKRFLSVSEFAYLRDHTTATPKVTLPSPSLFANFWSPQHSTGAYPTLDSFLADVANILRDEVAELARLGATYIQLDAPHYPLVLDPAWAEFYESQGWSTLGWVAQGIELDNAVMAGFPGVTFAFHL